MTKYSFRRPDLNFRPLLARAASDGLPDVLPPKRSGFEHLLQRQSFGRLHDVLVSFCHARAPIRHFWKSRNDQQLVSLVSAALLRNVHFRPVFQRANGQNVRKRWIQKTLRLRNSTVCRKPVFARKWRRRKISRRVCRADHFLLDAFDNAADFWSSWFKNVAQEENRENLSEKRAGSGDFGRTGETDCQGLAQKLWKI